MPEYSATKISAGSRIVLQMHYHLTQEAQQDKTGVRVRWTEGTPVMESSFTLMGNDTSQDENGFGLQGGENDPNTEPEFYIPAGESDHTETMRNQSPNLSYDLKLYMVANHMHYIGRDMRVWIEKANDDNECLLHTPEWDFDWQQFYFYDADNNNSPIISSTDEVWLQCNFDNTLDNPWVVQALQENGLSEPINVTLGEGSLDEMCLVVLATVPDIKLRHLEENHSGSFDATISSTPLDLNQNCSGPASFMKGDDGSVEGYTACGLEYNGDLISLEYRYTGTTLGGEVTLNIIGVGEYAGTWIGSENSEGFTGIIEIEITVLGAPVDLEGSFSVTQ